VIRDAVHIDFRKWDGSRHWQFDMLRLGEDEHGLWLWSPAGSPMQRGHEPAKQSRSVNVKLIPDGKWWTAIWAWQRSHDLYVDIITPAQWQGNTVTMVDIDLDIVRWSDGRVEVVDEDEFAEHLIRYQYPQRLVATARSTTAQLAVAVELGHEPFGEVAAAWMQRAVRLAEAAHG
jgi:protein associated with RNAse G/E